MCDPITIGMIGIGVGALGTGLSAFGAIQQGNYAAKMGKRQNEIAQKQAEYAMAAGEFKAGQKYKEAGQLVGQGRTAFAANNVLLEGADSSPVDWAGSMAAETAVDIAMIRSEAEMEAWGLRTAGQSALIEGQNAKQAGVMNATGSVLSGISQAALSGSQLSVAAKKK
jgi:hypothetical protein